MSLKIYRTPELLSTELKKFIQGQDECVDAVSIFMYQYLLYQYSQHSSSPLQNKPGLLILGSSGTGKTYLVKQLAKLIGFNFIEINAASLSQEGWHGISLKDVLGDNIELINSSYKNIVFLDEFDKFCSPSGAMGTKNVSFNLQSNLLKLIEGDSTNTKKDKSLDKINLKNICFIFSGSFEEVRNQIQKPQSVGFIQEKNDQNLLLRALEEFGVLPEILGRISLYIQTKEFTKEDYRQIIFSETSYFMKQKNLLAHIGVDLSISKLEIDKLLDRVYNNKIGARALLFEIDKLIQSLIKQSPDKLEFIIKYFEYLENSVDLFNYTEEENKNGSNE